MCYKCLDRYWLDGSQCVEGRIEHCLVYKTGNECEKCETHYNLVRAKSSTICLQILPNCKTLDLINDVAVCQECLEGFVEKSLQVSDQLTMCVDLVPVANCLEYDSGSGSRDSTLACKECQPEYFLHNGECLIRKNSQIEFCEKYSANLDNCEKCEDDYYLSENGLSCFFLNKGVAFCETYKSVNECSICRSGFFLHENKCNKVSLSIENCDRYTDNDLCKKCKQGYFLENNICVLSVARNCETQIDLKQCSTCRPGFFLEQLNSIVSCIEKQVDHCVEIDSWENSKCAVCQAGYYAVEGICRLARKPIANCEIQQNELECTKCDKGYYLDFNKEKCLDIHKYS